jgi:quinolinate synthase
MNQQDIKDEIRELLKKRNAVLLAHNYMRDEVQEIADITGDSLALSIEATKTEADVIVFCGVHFMAESASILSPDKTVLLPRLDAGCPMADMVTVEGLLEMKARFPGVPVVTYVNSTAAVKAHTDICCTSGNAFRVVASLAENELIFVPDRNLGRFIAKSSPKTFHFWDGFCPTHERLRPEEVLRLKGEYPDALFICHPECSPAIENPVAFW